MDLLSANNLTQLAAFLAPGFIVLGVRNRFKGGEKTDVTKNVVVYAIASSAYYAAIAPFFNVPWGYHVPLWLWSFLKYFVLPLLMGIIWVLIDQAEWFYRLCATINLRIDHHVPTAWEWAFRQKRGPSYVTVRLKGGESYYGTWTERSFASSNAAERDLYLDEVWNVDDTGAWAKVEPARSILICGRDISTVEMIGN